MAILAPGQGAQKPGMLSPWLELDGVPERLAGWSEQIGLDLARLGSTADAEEIQDTAVTQPLIVATSLIVYSELAKRVSLPDTSPVAGHSIGELAAAAIAGVFSPDNAVSLAAVRGREMAAACALEPTGMAAVMGGDPDEVVAWLDSMELTPANMNGAGQIVAAGSQAALDKLMATEDRPGVTKVIALKVAGAFHTRYMAPAEEALRAKAADLAVADPTRPLLSNADGTVVETGAEELLRLIAQVTRPVRWDLCLATLRERGVRAVIELTPAGALTGLVKRELKGTATLNLRTPGDLDKLADFVAEHESGH
ncbi:MAG TPA: ACP S-malonyltransferase [Pseudonocardiaceae bacterium]|jgi:[acyl-carrier-protein] S-malonyltransferase|nr:ACP S-malonyltransferase [Pseudonocardiaceae bacterium]